MSGKIIDTLFYRKQKIPNRLFVIIRYIIPDIDIYLMYSTVNSLVCSYVICDNLFMIKI